MKKKYIVDKLFDLNEKKDILEEPEDKNSLPVLIPKEVQKEVNKDVQKEASIPFNNVAVTNINYSYYYNYNYPQMAYMPYAYYMHQYPQPYYNPHNKYDFYPNIVSQSHQKRYDAQPQQYPKNSSINYNKTESKGFIFEKYANNNIQNKSENFKDYIKQTYDLDNVNLEGQEFNTYLKDHQDIKRINIKNLQKVTDNSVINEFVEKFEGVQPGTNYKRKIIREYVDQILNNELDKKFSDFIVKMRELYFKKKQQNPLKAKRRYVVGLREIEKFIRLEYLIIKIVKLNAFSLSQISKK